MPDDGDLGPSSPQTRETSGHDAEPSLKASIFSFGLLSLHLRLVEDPWEALRVVDKFLASHPHRVDSVEEFRRLASDARVFRALHRDVSVELGFSTREDPETYSPDADFEFTPEREAIMRRHFDDLERHGLGDWADAMSGGNYCLIARRRQLAFWLPPDDSR